MAKKNTRYSESKDYNGGPIVDLENAAGNLAGQRNFNTTNQEAMANEELLRIDAERARIAQQQKAYDDFLRRNAARNNAYVQDPTMMGVDDAVARIQRSGDGVVFNPDGSFAGYRTRPEPTSIGINTGGSYMHSMDPYRELDMWKAADSNLRDYNYYDINRGGRSNMLLANPSGIDSMNGFYHYKDLPSNAIREGFRIGGNDNLLQVGRPRFGYRPIAAEGPTNGTAINANYNDRRYIEKGPISLPEAHTYTNLNNRYMEPDGQRTMMLRNNGINGTANNVPTDVASGMYSGNGATNNLQTSFDQKMAVEQPSGRNYRPLGKGYGNDYVTYRRTPDGRIIDTYLTPSGFEELPSAEEYLRMTDGIKGAYEAPQASVGGSSSGPSSGSSAGRSLEAELNAHYSADRALDEYSDMWEYGHQLTNEGETSEANYIWRRLKDKGKAITGYLDFSNGKMQEPNLKELGQKPKYSTNYDFDNTETNAYLKEHGNVFSPNEESPVSTGGKFVGPKEEPTGRTPSYAKGKNIGSPNTVDYNGGDWKQSFAGEGPRASTVDGKSIRTTDTQAYSNNIGAKDTATNIARIDAENVQMNNNARKELYKLAQTDPTKAQQIAKEMGTNVPTAEEAYLLEHGNVFSPDEQAPQQTQGGKFEGPKDGKPSIAQGKTQKTKGVDPSVSEWTAESAPDTINVDKRKVTYNTKDTPKNIARIDAENAQMNSDARQALERLKIEDPVRYKAIAEEMGIAESPAPKNKLMASKNKMMASVKNAPPQKAYAMQTVDDLIKNGTLKPSTTSDNKVMMATGARSNPPPRNTSGGPKIAPKVQGPYTTTSGKIAGMGRLANSGANKLMQAYPTATSIGAGMAGEALFDAIDRHVIPQGFKDKLNEATMWADEKMAATLPPEQRQQFLAQREAQRRYNEEQRYLKEQAYQTEMRQLEREMQAHPEWFAD